MLKARIWIDASRNASITASLGAACRAAFAVCACFYRYFKRVILAALNWITAGELITRHFVCVPFRCVINVPPFGTAFFFFFMLVSQC